MRNLSNYNGIYNACQYVSRLFYRYFLKKERRHFRTGAPLDIAYRAFSFAISMKAITFS